MFFPHVFPRGVKSLGEFRLSRALRGFPGLSASDATWLRLYRRARQGAGCNAPNIIFYRKDSRDFHPNPTSKKE
jgi:hypothetical protein